VVPNILRFGVQQKFHQRPGRNRPNQQRQHRCVDFPKTRNGEERQKNLSLDSHQNDDYGKENFWIEDGTWS